MEEYAEQRVLAAMGSSADAAAGNGPETDPSNPLKLTRRGREQARFSSRFNLNRKFESLIYFMVDPPRAEEIRAKAGAAGEI